MLFLVVFISFWFGAGFDIFTFVSTELFIVINGAFSAYVKFDDVIRTDMVFCF